MSFSLECVVDASMVEALEMKRFLACEVVIKFLSAIMPARVQELDVRGERNATLSQPERRYACGDDHADDIAR
jgi:hypothetical protein